MSEAFFSASWYRVADRRPRLRAHAQIHPQRFRGKTWYVLQDHQSGQFHRLSPAANLIVALMDGQRSIAEIWTLAGRRLGREQPTQDETIRLLGQLHAADLLRGDVPPDLDELTRRADRTRRQHLLVQLRSVLAMRVPLLDPERFVAATLPLVAPVFSIAGFVVWLALIATGLVMAALHWSELTQGVLDRAFSLGNLGVLLLVYPCVKIVHELGHAYAVKRWGGEVHELGVMLLVFFPVPYVDASASVAFTSKWQRAVVGGAGIMVEAALAAMAAILWTAVEPGLVRAIAFNVMLVCGVSTLLFNANPLLRFDGYYVFADLIEIPNLAARANRYLGYLAKRHLLGVRNAVSPVTAPGEAGWFVGYAVASWIYRAVMILGIALLLAGQAFFIGVLLALWAVGGLVVWPLWKIAGYLVASPELARRRGRALAAAAATVGALAAIIALLPLPYATIAEGVVVVPEEAWVRAPVDGIVTLVAAGTGVAVAPGMKLIQLEDPFVGQRIAVLEAERREMALRLEAARVGDRALEAMLSRQLEHTEATLADERARLARLVLRAPRAGHLVLSDAADLPGRFLARGTPVGFVADDAGPLVRVVVDQASIDLVRRSTNRVAVRFLQDASVVVPAQVQREVPAAVDTLPSAVLSNLAGGTSILDPTDPRRLLEPAFLVDLRVAGPVPGGVVGSRVIVRFEHGTASLASRAVRAMRQLFLRELDV